MKDFLKFLAIIVVYAIPYLILLCFFEEETAQFVYCGLFLIFMILAFFGSGSGSITGGDDYSRGPPEPVD